MRDTPTLGIDVGGTNIKAGLVDPAGNVLARREIDTQAERGCEHVLARIVELARALMNDPAAGGRVVALGIGVPGPLSHKQGIVFHAPNLPGWVNVPIRSRLQEALNIPVCLENDANAAAYGEFFSGAGRDVDTMVMLTLGTGVGGGIILDGRLWRGSFDSAGEVGHMIVIPDGRACPCGQRGCLERYASAAAIGERWLEAKGGRGSAVGAPSTAEDVQRAMEAGDADATRVWDEACRVLALGCVNLQHLVNPQLVVLAGGLINAGAALLEPVRRHFDELSWRIAPDRPAIELARLGGNAGLIGAASLARTALDVSA